MSKKTGTFLGIDTGFWKASPILGFKTMLVNNEFKRDLAKAKRSASRTAERKEDENQNVEFPEYKNENRPEGTKYGKNKSTENIKTDKAEKEHPSEKAGAEKVVNDDTTAAMGGGARVNDPNANPNVLNFDAFGIKIDTDIGSETASTGPAQVPTFDKIVNGPYNPMGQPYPGYGPTMQNTVPPMYAGVPPVQQPFMGQQPPFVQQPPINVQPQHQPTPEEIKYAEDMKKYEQQKQDAAKVEKGKGNHKIDNPQPPKPPKVKAEADKVDVDLDSIKVPTKPPKPPKEVPPIVADPLPHAQPTDPSQQTVQIRFDNSELAKKYPFIINIEEVAKENNIDVQFLVRLAVNGNPNGLIDCYAYNIGKADPNPYKSFTIDTGQIIDGRTKIFPAILLQGGYEALQAYPMMIAKPSDEKGKKKNVFNKPLFDKFFKGGAQALNEKEDGLYSPIFRDLNKRVALITMPRANMDKEMRTKVQNRLVAAYKAGVFDSTSIKDPNSRFMFKDYDKKTGCFTLTNKGVPYQFGSPHTPQFETEIYFKIDETQVVPITTGA